MSVATRSGFRVLKTFPYVCVSSLKYGPDADTGYMTFPGMPLEDYTSRLGRHITAPAPRETTSLDELALLLQESKADVVFVNWKPMEPHRVPDYLRGTDHATFVDERCFSFGMMRPDLHGHVCTFSIMSRSPRPRGPEAGGPTSSSAHVSLSDACAHAREWFARASRIRASLVWFAFPAEVHPQFAAVGLAEAHRREEFLLALDLDAARGTGRLSGP